MESQRNEQEEEDDSAENDVFNADEPSSRSLSSRRSGVAFSDNLIEVRSSGSEDFQEPTTDEENGQDVETGVTRSPVVTLKDRRISLVSDRSQRAMLRPRHSSNALSPGDRKRLFLTSLWNEPGGMLPELDEREPVEQVGSSSDPVRSVENQRSETRVRRFLVRTKEIMSRRRINVVHKQYCLRAIPAKKTRFEKFGNILTCGINLEQVTINFLHWVFRQNFPVVIMTSAACFFFLTLLFTVFIWIAGIRQPQCIGGVDSTSGDFFSDAFILSWTTFSTVGYGLIYSGISADSGINDIRVCTAMTILVSLEAFVGVLFGGMCGAVLFIKVSRVQSFAQVTFSEIICVRYGTGVMVEEKEENEESRGDGSQSTTDEFSFFPSPILEFRVVNRLHSITGGEIIDTSVNVVASIDASQACHTLKTHTRKGTKKKRGGRRTIRKPQRRMSHDEASNDSVNFTSPPSTFSRPPTLRKKSSFRGANNRLSTAVEEDPTGHFLPKRIMSKLECLTHDHPFFKRVFILRHTLDHNSPLLTTLARQRVKKSGGLWPVDMTNAESVRRSIQFDHLLVSLSGTSNADANSVYAQTVYEFSDVLVGYRFVNTLYRDATDGTLKVDTNLVNDVMEQAGGGGEPLHRRARGNMNDVPVL